MIDVDRFTTAEVGGEVFLLDKQSDQSFRIGGSGARLWSLLVSGSTPAEASHTIASETGAPFERVLADTTAFVMRLRESGIIESD